MQIVLMQRAHERLKRARELAGYETASEAANALGQPQPTYMAHENGSRGFKAEAERYARFFKVNLEWLLTGRGEPRSRSLDSRVQALPTDQQQEVLNFLEYIENRARLRDTG
jgi:transcriptional regulator with XRE-family HTH domain